MKANMRVLLLLCAAIGTYAEDHAIAWVNPSGAESSITVKVGDTVTWTWSDNHDVTWTDAVVGTETGVKGTSGYSVKFVRVGDTTVVGAHAYYCSIHGSAGAVQFGTITVEPKAQGGGQGGGMKNMKFGKGFKDGTDAEKKAAKEGVYAMMTGDAEFKTALTDAEIEELKECAGTFLESQKDEREAAEVTSNKKNFGKKLVEECGGDFKGLFVKVLKAKANFKKNKAGAAIKKFFDDATALKTYLETNAPEFYAKYFDAATGKAKDGLHALVKKLKFKKKQGGGKRTNDDGTEGADEEELDTQGTDDAEITALVAALEQVDTSGDAIEELAASISEFSEAEADDAEASAFEADESIGGAADPTSAAFLLSTGAALVSLLF